MNSEDDLFDFEFSQQDNTNSVLNDIFDVTQKQMDPYRINTNKRCTLNNLLNSEFNYKKFIYPSNEDIIKEMEDTQNPNINCWKSVKNDMIDQCSSDLDSEILRQFDFPMTLPDENFDNNCEKKVNIDFESQMKNAEDSFSQKVTNENYSKCEIGNKFNTNLYVSSDFEVDLDLSILSKESQPEIEFRNKKDIKEIISGFKTGTGKSISLSKSNERKASKIFESLENELYKEENQPEINLEKANTDCYKNNNVPCVGFKTGTGQKISISNSSKNKAKQLLEEIEEKKILDEIIETNLQTSSVEFTTAAGQIIQKPESALNQARELFDEIEGNNNENISGIVEFKPDSYGKKFPLKNASNIDQSDARKLVEYNKSIKFDDENKSIFEDNKEKSKGLIGLFKTGTGRVISISESAELKSKRIFEEVSKEIDPDELQACKEISSLENLEENKFEQDKHKIFNDQSKDQSIKTDKIVKEADDMDSSWDYFQMEELENSKDTIGNYLGSLVQSPIINKSSGSKANKEIHLLSSTPIRKSKSRLDIHLGSLNSNSISNRVDASKSVQERIAHKKVTGISVNAGRFSLLRLNNRQKLFPLKELFQLVLKTEGNVGIIEKAGEKIDFKSCIDMKFYCNDKSIVSLEVGDNGMIVPDEDGYIGLQQFIDSFMSLPYVDPKLITVEWIKNHYQMILWKLMSLEIRFRNYLSNDWLSPHHIMLQLKYRYDKEIDNVKRPALRKICEQDDTASKRLVLVVVSIENIGNDSYEVLVSDGWYCVPAILDKFLKDQIYKKKIKSGTKLVTCNAVWTGCDEPIVLPTNSFPPGSGLKLHGNSTRRARAFAKLGYQSNPSPFPLTLGSLNVNGGTVSLINVVINRIYPIQYMEKIYQSDEEAPRRIFRNERAEEFARKQFDQSKENIINKTLDKMMSPAFISKKRSKMDKITDQSNGEDILNWLNNSIDQESAQIELSMNQQETLRTYRENLVSNALQAKCPNRNVVTLLRILVGGCLAADIDFQQVAILTLWKPNDDLMTLFAEGASIKIYSVGVTHTKVDAQFSVTNAPIALNSISSTRFERNTEIHENLIAKVFQPRQLLSISDTCQFLSNSTKACEIDCIGIVIAFSKEILTANDSWQHVVLSDPDNMDDGLILVKLWGGLKGNFLTNVIENGNCVKFQNLTYRRTVFSRFNPDSKVPVFECHCGTHSNIVYISRKWNFHTMKQSIREKLEKCLPSFELFCHDKYNSSKSLSFRTSVLSPLDSKAKIIKISNSDHSLQVSDTKYQFSPKIITSTPKRLGLSRKRVVRMNNAETISQNNELLNKDKNEESKIQIESKIVSNSSNYNYDDSFDMDSSIAELVKVRRRASTTNASYVHPKKNK